MVRPTHWMRDRAEQVTPGADVPVILTNIHVNQGETLLRLRFAYQLVGQAPLGNVIAQFHGHVIGVALYKNAATTTSFPAFGPWQSPNVSDIYEWLWWEGVAWEHWQPTTSDPRWRAPRGEPYRDVKAERISPSNDATPAQIAVWYQQDITVDWESALYVTASALIADAP